MRFTHRHRHRFSENLYVHINGKKVLTIKNIQKMAIISINVDDNQADLDALKSQITQASADFQTALTNAQAAIAAFEAFQITFTASVAPTPPSA